MKKVSFWFLAFLLAVACLPGCKTANVTSERDLGTPTAVRPAVVYVADFELWAQTIQQESGVLANRPGPVGRIGSRLSGGSSDPAARARQLVELMAESLVKDLGKAGFTAVRLAPDAPLPKNGWLLRGVFTEVQEGNRLQRAIIGFGQGETDIQVVAVVNDLSKGPPEALYEVATDANSGKTVGAGPTIALNPYGAAARFVMARKDLEKNVKQTAEKIAEEMTKRAPKPS